MLLFLSVRSPFSISFFLPVSFSLADCPVTEYSGCPSKRRGFVIWTRTSLRMMTNAERWNWVRHRHRQTDRQTSANMDDAYGTLATNDCMESAEARTKHYAITSIVAVQFIEISCFCLESRSQDQRSAAHTRQNSIDASERSDGSVNRRQGSGYRCRTSNQRYISNKLQIKHNRSVFNSMLASRPHGNQ